MEYGLAGDAAWAGVPLPDRLLIPIGRATMRRVDSAAMRRLAAGPARHGPAAGA